MKNPAKHTGLILVATIAFLCATVLAIAGRVAARASQNQWLLSKQAAAIACNKNVPGDTGSSGDKNNGSGCAHQPGASCLLTISGDKRNKTNSC